MASTSYLTRVIYKLHTSDVNSIPGTYRLLLAGKSIPSPTSDPNTVEATTFENDSQVFASGIKQSSAKAFTGNLEKDKLAELLQVEGEKCDIMQLYGTDGVGGVAKSAYVGQITPTVSDVSGVDSILGMTATVIQNTSPVWVTDDYTVTDNGDGTFTVAASSTVTPQVVLNNSNISIVNGRTAKLKATTKPAGASVTWTSSDTEVATVSSNGVVTAEGTGTATITATITVSATNYTDTCAVTVTAS